MKTTKLFINRYGNIHVTVIFTETEEEWEKKINGLTPVRGTIKKSQWGGCCSSGVNDEVAKIILSPNPNLPLVVHELYHAAMRYKEYLKKINNKLYDLDTGKVLRGEEVIAYTLQALLQEFLKDETSVLSN